MNQLKELCELIDSAGGRFTFSANCVSGVIGRDQCQCWRCRGVPIEDEDSEWKDVAAGHSAEFRRKILESLRQLRSGSEIT